MRHIQYVMIDYIQEIVKEPEKSCFCEPFRPDLEYDYNKTRFIYKINNVLLILNDDSNIYICLEEHINILPSLHKMPGMETGGGIFFNYFLEALLILEERNEAECVTVNPVKIGNIKYEGFANDEILSKIKFK